MRYLIVNLDTQICGGKDRLEARDIKRAKKRLYLIVDTIKDLEMDEHGEWIPLKKWK